MSLHEPTTDQRLALETLLLATFQPRETWLDLDTVIKLAFGRDHGLTTDLGHPGDIGLRTIVQRLLDMAERLGGLSQLAAGLQAHPPIASHFANWISEVLPELSAQGAGITTQVESIQGGVHALSQLRMDPRVREIILAAKMDFRHLSRGVQNLSAYKDLHDALHTVQLGLLRQIRDAAREIAKGGAAAQTAVATLDIYLNDLDTHRADVDAGFAAMAGDDADRKVEVGKLVSRMEAAARRLEKAVLNADPQAAFEGSVLLSSLVRDQAPRLNFWLVEAARALPVQRLVETFQSAGARLPQGDPQRQALETAGAGLTALVPEMRRYVLQHEAWQQADTTMWRAEDAMERADDLGLIEFGLHWPDLQIQIEAICGSAQERWALSLRRLATEFGVACPLPCAPPAPPGARGALERYLTAGRQRFYVVDKALKAGSAEVRQLSTPFERLLSEVAE